MDDSDIEITDPSPKAIEKSISHVLGLVSARWSSKRKVKREKVCNIL